VLLLSESDLREITKDPGTKRKGGGMRSLKARFAVGVAVLAAIAVVGIPASAAVANSYTVHPLVSDEGGAGVLPESSVVNAWGLVAGPTTPWWISDNATDKSTLYNVTTNSIPLVVGVGGGPTGIVFHNATTDPTNFVLPAGGSARFIFASEDGVIRGWNGGPAAQIPVQDTVPGAIYKGLAIAGTGSAARLYAADFHNAQVNVFDGAWHLVPNSGFVDPSLPAGYAPFGIQAIGSRIFVTYAKQDADAEDEVAGQGLGFVAVYDTSGNLLGQVAQHGQLNAPWGLAWAPSSFGRFGGDLLVGNFGDGQINAYEELRNGHFEHRGELRDAAGKSLTIDGLWALQFGNGAAAGPTGTLFFTAGPDDESHGLFGSITPGS
jgi:uncharacterized protein (TIGR03118 family)